MNTRTERVARITKLGLIAVLAGFAALSSASEQTVNRTMVIYSDVIGASEILSNDYATAIEKMANIRGQGEMKISILNNLCVAYTLIGNLEKARASCDKVIHEAAQTKNYGDWFQRYNSGRAMRRYKSRAYANRSIFRMASGNATGAAHDWEHVRPHDR